MLPTLRPVRDEYGRLWVNSQTDTQALERLRAALAADGVSAVDPPKPVSAEPLLADGQRLAGHVYARRRGTHCWEGLVLLERQYATGPTATFWHLICQWMPQDRIYLLADTPTGQIQSPHPLQVIPAPPSALPL